MATTDLDLLRARLASRNLVVIYGTGVTIAATGDRDLSWPAVIKAGARFVERTGLAPTSHWKDIVESNLQTGDAGSIKPMLLAAELVEDAMKANDGQAFMNWLDVTFGRLEAKNPAILEQLVHLEVPLLTTNYDTLLEDNFNWTSVHQDNPALALRVLDGSSPAAVVHLHGVWNQPETIVLSNTDYAKMSNDKGTGAVLRSILLVKSILYVGFGAGLSDPNFKAAQEWVSSHVGPTHPRHFRLCRSSELPELTKVHGSDNVVPVAYGDAHDDLSTFLKELGQGNTSEDSGLEPISGANRLNLARSAIGSRIREEGVLQPAHAVDSELDPLTLLVPPVLLPIPQEAYAVAQPQGFSPPDRLDPLADVTGTRTILVVGGSDTGLTSALRWFTLTYTKNNPDSIPLVVEGKSLRTNSKTPLTTALRREASRTGIIATPNSPLPPLALAIDDFVLNPKSSQRILADLRSLSVSFCVIGSREGQEDSISRLFADAGLPLSVRYLGSYNSSDIRAMAKIIDPPSAGTLTNRALRAISSHGLKRTPYNVALLLTVLASGDEKITDPTQASLVRQYVSKALSRNSTLTEGGSFESPDLEDILEHFAGTLAEARVLRMALGDFLSLLQTYMTKVGWSFDAVAALGSLLQLRLLTLVENMVSFSQPAFLFHFAARRMANDDQFSDEILRQPATYWQVITHYASTNRSDARLLAFILDLVEEMELPVVRGYTLPAWRTEPEESEDSSGSEYTGTTTFDRVLWSLDAVAEDTIFLEAPAEESGSDPWMQASLLSMAGSVLRALDLVKNRELKRGAFKLVFEQLARIGPALVQSDDYEEFRAASVKFFSQLFDADERSQEMLARAFTDAIPHTYALAVVMSMANPKNYQPTVELLNDEEFMENEEAYSLALAHLFFIGRPGYGRFLRRHAESRRSRPSPPELALHRAVFQAYMADAVPPGDENDVELFLAYSRGDESPSGMDALRKDTNSRWVQALRRHRLQRRAEHRAAVLNLDHSSGGGGSL